MRKTKVNLLIMISILLLWNSCIKLKTHFRLNNEYEKSENKKIGLLDYRIKSFYKKGNFKLITIFENFNYANRDRSLRSNLFIFKKRKIHSVFIYPVFEERKKIEDSIYKILAIEKLQIDKDDSTKINHVLDLTVKQYPLPSL